MLPLTKEYQPSFFLIGLITFTQLYAADTTKDRSRLYAMAKDGIIGGIAGGLEPFFTQPFMNIKYQKQQHNRSLGAIAALLKNRPSLLYTGVGINIICSAPAIATQIAFDKVIQDIIPSNNIAPFVMRNTIIGAFSALTCNSTELVMANQQNNTHSAMHIIKDLYRKNGIAVFGRGFLAKAARDSIFCTGFLTWYPHTKTIIHEKLNEHNQTGALSSAHNPIATIIAATLIGVPTALTSQPFDTASTDLQTDPSKIKFNGYMDVIHNARKDKEGYKILFRGGGSRLSFIVLAIPIITSIKDAIIKIDNQDQHQK